MRIPTWLGGALAVVVASLVGAGSSAVETPTHQTWRRTKPDALLALEQYRETAFKRGVIHWTRRDFMRGQVNRYVAKFAGGEYVLLLRDMGGNEPALPAWYVSRCGAVWEAAPSAPGVAHRFESGSGAPVVADVRAADLGTNLQLYGSVHTAIWHRTLDGLPVEYVTIKNPREHVVHMRWRSGEHRHESIWTLDSGRGWCPTRIQVLYDGRLVMERRVAPREYQGVWLFESVAQYRQSYKDGKEPFALVTIDSVVLGEGAPAQLSPGDIGLDVGTTVFTKPDNETLFWDGSAAVPGEVYGKRLRSGELKMGPRLKEYLERSARELRASDAAADPRLVREIRERTFAQWQTFVENYAAVHRFSAAQSKAARGVLDDCRAQAEAYVRQARDRFDECERTERLSRQALDSDERQAVMERSMRLRDELLRPIEDIFEKQLRPRVEAIRTEAQRGQADPAAR